MKTRISFFSVAAVMATALYLLVPACGSKSNNQPVAPGFGGVICQPGQFCQNPGGFGGQGIPLLPGVVMTVIDSRGSVAQLQFGGNNVVAGQPYNGPVSISGVLNIMPGGYCPPSSYNIQGSGQWASNYGGKVAAVQGSFQLVGGNFGGGGGQGSLSGLISYGQDPNIQQPTQFYFQGNFPTSCDPYGVGL